MTPTRLTELFQKCPGLTADEAQFLRDCVSYAILSTVETSLNAVTPRPAADYASRAMHREIEQAAEGVRRFLESK